MAAIPSFDDHARSLRELTEFLVDRFAIAGTPSECVAQIDRARAAGAHQFIITSFVPDPRAFMRRWAREVARPGSVR